MRLKLLKIISVLLAIALIVCAVFLGRAYWRIHSIGGWKDEVYVLSGYKGSVAALDDFRCSRLRLFELGGLHDMPAFSGRRSGDFEIWYAQFFGTGEAHRYATEQFIEFYNRKMEYMHKHPEKFLRKTDAGANNAVEPTRALTGASGSP